ncbi:MAG: GAF domain-containing sensor histidine kinase, partial [Xenococcaceae cyanobacterium]
MSNSDYIFPTASAEFIALCKSQTILLNQGLGAVWSAVYLTQESAEDRHKQLIPVVSYPNQGKFLPQDILETRWLETQQPRFLPSLNSTNMLGEETQPRRFGEGKRKKEKKSLSTRQQTVLPLVYQDTVMGFLIAIREDRQWNQTELAQVEQIANTLAIACYLDRRQLWYKQQLDRQENLRTIEHDRLDTFVHQLRNPITALRTFSKLLLKRLLPSDRDRSIAQGILRESDRVEDLLKQFNEEIEPRSPLILPEANSVSTSNFLLPSSFFESEYLLVVEVLLPLLPSFEAIAQEKQIELISQLPANLSAVRANAKALREIFSNLIDNAIKYTPPGGRVEIIAGIESNTPTGNYQGIAIGDTGYGIPLEDRQHLFERHYRGAQAEGDIPGTGLGLAIAKELLEKMQGKI